MNKALLILAFLSVSIGLLAQKYSFVNYSTEQGLPQTQVADITQDDKGYLWVGTIGGLAKFGGNKFETFSSNDGLLNNRITSLDFFDGTLWVGHDGGVSYIKNNTVDNISFVGSGNDRSRKVSQILKFNNKLIVCSNGGGLFQVQGRTLKKIKLSNTDFEKIRGAYTYNNKLFLATKGGVLVTHDLKTFELLSGLNEGSFSGITGYDDVIVFATYKSGLFIRNMKSGEQNFIDGDALKYSVAGCYIDESNDIWLSTLDGVIHVKSPEEINFFDESSGMPVNMIGCIFSDNSNNIWIGSQGKGIFRFPSSDFKYYDQTTNFPSDLFLTGFQDGKGDYYFGSYDKGVLKWTKDKGVKMLKSPELTIWASVKNVDGKHWFGGSGSIVTVDENDNVKSIVATEENQMPGSKVTAFYKVSNSSMYVGGNAGVSLYSNGTFKKLGKGENADIGTVRDFVYERDTLFCATNLGLYVFVKGQFKMISDPNQVVYNIEIDEFKNVWFGTENGLFRYKNGSIERIELFEDLGSNSDNFLNHYKGKLYVGTNNGLFVMADLNAKKPSFTRFGIGDGIIDLETNLNSGFFDKDGVFWFGTASGLVSYNPETVLKKKVTPRVHLISIQLNYSDFDYKKYATSLSEEGLPLGLELPRSMNNLIFELDGVSLAHQKAIGYQYYLKGLRDDWSTISENPTITFTSLPAGEYELVARAVDIDGGFSKEIRFPFIIHQAFYNTWWFITLCLMLLTGIIVVFFRYRIRRIAELNEKERLEFKSRLLSLEQQSMNASMNRHFIFNSLNSIQYFINTQDKLSANKYLTSFAQLIRKNLDSASTVDNLITLDKELERLKLYLSLESMRFKGRFDYKFEVNDVDTESILIPPMIMQPFIENSIIHGVLPREDDKGLIKIVLTIVDSYLHILIEDNGVGITESLKNKRAGSGDHKSQGMEITSKRIELIKKISRKNISLMGPDEIIGSDGLVNGTRVLIKIPMFDLEN